MTEAQQANQNKIRSKKKNICISWCEFVQINEKFAMQFERKMNTQDHCMSDFGDSSPNDDLMICESSDDANNNMDLTNITCELLKNHPFAQLEQRPPK